ncbi:hypothetical protein [Methanocella arvoryzae]|nr:hypothetical protein [Methanocella arvoryzae]
MSLDSGVQQHDSELIPGETGRWMAVSRRKSVNPADELRFIAEYSLPGIIGFALGGFLWGVLQVFFPGFSGVSTDILSWMSSGSYTGILFWIAGGLIFGFSGAYCLDILPGNRLKMAALSAAGYATGLAFMVVATELIMKGHHLSGGLFFATGIVAVGLIFGLPLKRSQLFVILGSIGFVAGGALGLGLYHTSIFLIHSHYLPYMGWLPGLAMLVGLGIGTGAVMGLGKYLVETR